jgi:hypothetical protein
MGSFKKASSAVSACLSLIRANRWPGSAPRAPGRVVVRDHALLASLAVIEPMPPLDIHDAPPCSSIHLSEPSRAVCLFLHFELLDECSEMLRHRSRKGVVLVLEAPPDC